LPCLRIPNLTEILVKPPVPRRRSRIHIALRFPFQSAKSAWSLVKSSSTLALPKQDMYQHKIRRQDTVSPRAAERVIDSGTRTLATGLVD
ncbi:hypothetical protein KCU59_g23, partial [Aureobasidium melanogenum]